MVFQRQDLRFLFRCSRIPDTGIGIFLLLQDPIGAGIVAIATGERIHSAKGTLVMSVHKDQ
jgi:hypothetical protein